MNEETNIIPTKRRPDYSVDDMDRKILGLLSADATQSYAALGAAAGLSAPAVHERVKRLKAAGVIQRTTVDLDGAKVGRPFLAFVQVTFACGGCLVDYSQLEGDPDVEEAHSVAGDSCVMLKVRCASAQGLEDLLGRLRKLGDIIGTRSHVVLSTYLERGVQVLNDAG